MCEIFNIHLKYRKGSKWDKELETDFRYLVEKAACCQGEPQSLTKNEETRAVWKAKGDKRDLTFYKE